ncbi:hypothetical protein Hdeb2414_s0008g00273741 [Helianthus debilis subsp. tardiflorus]
MYVYVCVCVDIYIGLGSCEKSSRLIEKLKIILDHTFFLSKKCKKKKKTLLENWATVTKICYR